MGRSGLICLAGLLAMMVSGIEAAEGFKSASQVAERRITLLFFQPGGERVIKPFSFAYQISSGQPAPAQPSARQMGSSGWIRANSSDGQYLLTVPAGREPQILIGIEGDGRRYDNTMIILTAAKDLTTYPVFLAPVAENPSTRFRPGTTSYDELVPAAAKDALTAALKAGDEGRLGLAISEISRALQITPRFPSALNQLGLLFYRSGKLSEAVSAFTQAVTIRDRTPHPYLNLGVSLNRLGQYMESINILTGLLEANPTMTRIRIPLAEALVQIQQWDAAVEMLQPAMGEIDQLPLDLQAESRFILARTMFREERYRATVREVTRALAISTTWSNAANAWLLLGRSHFELKQDSEAETALLKAVEIGGRGMSLAQFTLGQIYARQNQTDRAIKALETFLKAGRDEADGASLQEARSILNRLRGEMKVK